MAKKTTLHKLNVSRIIAYHLIGKNHKKSHRMVIGGVIIMVGVLIAKFGEHTTYTICHYLLDGAGYLIHGIGAIPYIEYVIELEAEEL